MIIAFLLPKRLAGQARIRPMYLAHCDHWVRDEAEWKRIVAQIEHNPVKAWLVQHAEDYRKRRDESRRCRHECPRHVCRNEVLF